MKRDSITNTFVVATVLCLVCSFAVAGSVYLLKDRQDANVENYRKKNVLDAAGLLPPGVSNKEVNEMYDAYVIEKVVEIPSGKDVTSEYEGKEPYDQEKASEDKKKSIELNPKEDIASLKRMETRSYMYIIKRSPSDDSTDKYVFPIRGKGLWSMMKGFVSVSADAQQIKGLSYYDQGETPGLGGEVENPDWKAKWESVKLYDKNGEVAVKVAKGTAANEYQVDGLSGATITSNGVTYMLQYWLGEKAFGPLLKKIQEEKNSKQTAVQNRNNASVIASKETKSSQTGDNNG